MKKMPTSKRPITAVSCFLLFLPAVAQAQSNLPGTAYIFPAGGQRGSNVEVIVGGYNLTASTQLHVDRGGIEQSGPLTPTGKAPPVPLIKREEANRPFNYPREMTTTLRIAADAPLGLRVWQVWTAHGGTAARPFVVGDLPEVVEQPASASPQRLSLPMTANGRIELAEEVDSYVFQAEAGERISSEIVADGIGSTLDARLEVLDPAGQEIASAEDSRGLDPIVTFTAATSGDYVVRVHDYAYTGSPSHVYRLTVREPLKTVQAKASTDQAAEVGEAEPNDKQPQSLAVQSPIFVKGRLESDDVDRFRFQGNKGDRFMLSVSAARLGSSIDTLLTVCDSADKELARSDDIPGSSDSELEFVVPADGEYVLSVSDLSGSPRVGMPSDYRLFAAPAQPGFSLQLAVDHADVAPGGSAQIAIKVVRQGGFEGEIDLELAGLARGLSAESLQIPAKKNDHKLTLKADANAENTGSPLTIAGSAKMGDQTVRQVASIPLLGGNSPASAESVLVTVTHPSRFKITADDTYFFRSRGTTHPATIRIEREPGFDGDIVLSLADMQTRYLQGIHAPTMVVPGGVTEVTYPLVIPESVELNRTCRVLVAGTAVVKGADDRVHHLLAVSPKQCVMRMEPAILSVQATPDYLEPAPGSSVELRLDVQRALEFNAAVHLELALPEGAHGISVDSFDLAADQTSGKVTLRLAPDADLAGHNGIRIRAVAQRDGLPAVAEAFVEMHLTPSANAEKPPHAGTK